MEQLDSLEFTTDESAVDRVEQEQIAILERHYRGILEAIGEDLEREGLAKTPFRAAQAMKFLTRGYGQSVEEVVNGAIFESDIEEIVLVKNIELYSFCEHHILPFIGKCHVGYIPQGKVIGLSKVARIVDVFAQRLQIQENLTVQIANALEDSIHPLGIGVVIEAQHLCMMMRGVEKQNSVMTTSCLLGVFKDNASTRSEFLSLLR
jgi:GTP cyclohydrolase IA